MCRKEQHRADCGQIFFALAGNLPGTYAFGLEGLPSGWSLVAADGVARFTIPNGAVIPARGHYLGVNSSGYSLMNYGGTGNAAGDISYTSDIADNTGIALFRTVNPENFTPANALDAVDSAALPRHTLRATP